MWRSIGIPAARSPMSANGFRKVNLILSLDSNFWTQLNLKMLEKQREIPEIYRWNTSKDFRNLPGLFCILLSEGKYLC